MKVLALTTRTKVTRKHATRLKARLGLGNGVRIELVTVYPPTQRLPVHRVDSVDPSVIPWRPLVPVKGAGLRDWKGPRRQVVQLLRSARAGTESLRPESLRLEPGTYLAIACATSRDLARRAKNVDIILAVEPEAARAAWQLARRVEGPAVVQGAPNVRRVLETLGRPIPRAPSVEAAEPDEGHSSALSFVLPEPPEPASRRLLIAPANYAGQAYAWAASVRRHVDDATAMNARAGDLKIPFLSDYSVGTGVFASSLRWRIAWRDFVLKCFSHVIVEANRPIFGAVAGDGRESVADLRRAGKTVALLSHGSDARVPSVHASRERWHSYDALDPGTLRELEERSRVNVEFYNSYDGPVFVSTPGLLEFVPRGTWLPLVVDPELWQRDEVPLQRELPIVAHIPSSAQKGSHMIDPILQSMHDRRLIEYRRVEGVQHDQMPTLYGTADIMVEQFGIADYSAAACEAMAAGRVVVSRVADGVREKVRADTGLDLPVAEADPTTLESVILELAEDRDRARALAEQGREFVRAVHDGRRSAAVLGAWLDGGELWEPGPNRS